MVVSLHMAQDKNVNLSQTDDKYVVQRIGGGSIVDRRPVFSPDGTILFVVYGQIIRAYSTRTGQLVRDYKGLSQPAVGVQLHPTRPELVVAVSESGEMMAWREDSGIHMLTVKLSVAAQCDHLFSFNLLPSEDGDCDIFVTWQKKNSRQANLSVFSSKGKHKTDFNFSIDIGTHSVAFAFGCHSNGKYVAAICKDRLYSTDLARNKGNWFRVSKGTVLTCVACHPTECCVATGDARGRVLIWRDIIDNPAPPQAVYHWHTLPVADVVFSQSGSFFFSGGGECVLVKWRLDNPHDKSFLPRLSAPICHLNTSKDNLIVSASTQDNAIQLIDPQRQIFKRIQYFSWGVQSAGHDLPLFPAGLNFDRRTHSLVLNSRTGHIQFYSPRTHSILYNLDITVQNYITQERNVEIINTEVICVALSNCGKWLSTVEYIDNGEMTVQVSLKFYTFNHTTQRHSLNTSINLPHDGRVYALRFRPAENDDMLMAVTTGADKKFRIWGLASGKHWHCISMGHYRDLSVRDAAFSSDGSVLGISFDSTLTLWNPDSCDFQCSLSPATPKGPPIMSIQFGSRDCCHLVVAGSSEGLTVWSILTLSIVWTVPLELTILCKDPFSKYMAAFTKDNTLYVFSPKESKPVFRHQDICPSGTRILCATFAPRMNPKSDGSWQASSQLYFIDSNQELLALQNAKEITDVTESGLEGLPEWAPALTPFSSLVAKQTSSSAIAQAGTQHNQLGLAGRKELEELLAAPAHTMPPQHLLCGGILGSLLVRTTSADGDAEQDDDREPAAAADSDSSDDEDDKAVSVEKKEEPAVAAMAAMTVAQVEDAEAVLKKVLSERLDWAESLLL
ncbi:WD repeat-containing protein 75 [Thrips palmi]|uniref:WD repeat-containing protein 75 n=1 Tax=Thrips palmi TaxID=161013 RepID=A0A6P8ZVK9_THRPL|nr:WD repeat-containing protein 75 [Thrips palmi]